MKRKAVCLSLFLIVISALNTLTAQYYFYDNDYYDSPLLFELGGSVGAMNSLTDLGGKKGIGKRFIKDLNLKNTHFAGSIFVSATYQNMFAVRLEGTFGQVSGADSVLKSVKTTTYGRYERNLSFRSRISEIMLAAEIHPVYIFSDFSGDRMPSKMSPYLLAGVGYFSFNPEAKLQNNWIALQPLRTEGQGFDEYPGREPYKLSQICIPLGAGLRYDLSPMFNLRAEFVYRILQTDYLDDVSHYYIDPSTFANNLPGNKATQAMLLYSRRYEIEPGYSMAVSEERGDPKDNDSYFTLNLKLSLIIGRQRIKAGWQQH